MTGRTRGGGPQRCPSCGSPILRQWVGDTAAIQATVDLPAEDEHLPYGPAHAARNDRDDLVWCLPRLPFRALRLRWTGGRHPPDCPHQHLTSHHCPTNTLF